MAQNPRPPYRPSSTPGSVPPQAGPPRSGAAQRPGGGQGGSHAPRSAGAGPGGTGPARRTTGVERPGGSVLPRRPLGDVSDPRRVTGGTSTGAARPTVATTVAEAEKKEKKDLTINKVLAGAGAAATSAVFGSYFGAAGTVAGAALGSVVTTLAATMYQRSLDRTREIALQKVRLPGRGDTRVLAEPVDPLATIPLQRGSTGSPMLAPVLPSAPKRARLTRKRVVVALVSTVAAFLIGLLAITGVEWIKGSPISGGESGTSVSRVVTGGSAAPDGETTGTTESVSPTTTKRAPESTDGSTESTGGASPTTSPAPTSSTTPTTTSRAPGSAGQDGTGQSGAIQGGGGSAAGGAASTG
ncbi:hypothetical protein [Pseudonocardia xishanensis]